MKRVRVHEQLKGLGLFEEPKDGDVRVAHRDVRIDPPAAPGSASSERGAAKAKKSADTQMEGILAILARLPDGACISRDEIIARYGPSLSVNAACGRLHTLVHSLNHVDVVENAATSAAGNRVSGYKLSALGRLRIQRRAS
jgi:hypothetical protein